MPESSDDDDPETALAIAISRYCSAHGVERAGLRLLKAMRVLKHQAKVYRVHDRILTARFQINRAAIERFDVHDDDGAEKMFGRPTPAYRGALSDDGWLRQNCGYGIQEGQGDVYEPETPAPTPPAETPAPAKGLREARTREAKGEGRFIMAEPEATAAVLLAALVDDPARVDAHVETLAALPCGRWALLREWLIEREESQLGLLHPGAQELIRAMMATGARPGAYSAAGWERAARALVARYSQP